eukprot:TRINITY_DN2681_c0_g2_i4.p1 TRINITY_DN2681_c0_g2~~TRINITY_DN2681_c0_g2_i4.p1  ORF type:complete len:113 (+),score=27.80 TRINITY_DN2681_c0_g2_i4:65-403(+)
MCIRDRSRNVKNDAYAYKETVQKLQGLIGKSIEVKFLGGRTVAGVLQSLDNNLNLIIDECVEHIRDAADPYTLTKETRTLGFVIVRGSLIMSILNKDGMEEISNPFKVEEDS